MEAHCAPHSILAQVNGKMGKLFRLYSFSHQTISSALLLVHVLDIEPLLLPDHTFGIVSIHIHQLDLDTFFMRN